MTVVDWRTHLRKAQQSFEVERKLRELERHTALKRVEASAGLALTTVLTWLGIPLLKSPENLTVKHGGFSFALSEVNINRANCTLINPGVSFPFGKSWNGTTSKMFIDFVLKVWIERGAVVTANRYIRVRESYIGGPSTYTLAQIEQALLDLELEAFEEEKRLVAMAAKQAVAIPANNHSIAGPSSPNNHYPPDAQRTLITQIVREIIHEELERMGYDHA